MTQKRTIQFYRNTKICATREEALKIFTDPTGIIGDTSLADGEPVIARYESDGNQHTILGINRKIDGKNNFEIFEGHDQIQEEIKQAKTDSVVTVKKAETAENGMASTYIIHQGNNDVEVKINIPKDQFLKKAEYINSAQEADKQAQSDVIVGNPYLKFTWQLTSPTDGSNNHAITYVSVNDLVDRYAGSTAEQAAEGGINISLDDVAITDTTQVNGAGKIIKAVLNDKAVTKTKLSQDLQNLSENAIADITSDGSIVFSKQTGETTGATATITTDASKIKVTKENTEFPDQPSVESSLTTLSTKIKQNKIIAADDTVIVAEPSDEGTKIRVNKIDCGEY